MSILIRKACKSSIQDPTNLHGMLRRIMMPTTFQMSHRQIFRKHCCLPDEWYCIHLSVYKCKHYAQFQEMGCWHLCFLQSNFPKNSFFNTVLVCLMDESKGGNSMKFFKKQNKIQWDKTTLMILCNFPNRKSNYYTLIIGNDDFQAVFSSSFLNMVFSFLFLLFCAWQRSSCIISSKYNSKLR